MCTKTRPVRVRKKRSPQLVFVSFILAKLRAWRRYRETVDELSRLSDRELADVGISRYDIDRTARDRAVS